MGVRIREAVRNTLGYNAFYLTAGNISVYLLYSSTFQLRIIASDKIVEAHRNTTVAKERKRQFPSNILSEIIFTQFKAKFGSGGAVKVKRCKLEVKSLKMSKKTLEPKRTNKTKQIPCWI